MYRDYYGLALDPFGMDPNLDFLFISHAHEEAVSHIAYGLEQHEPIILITGDIGTGKTVALQRVIAQLSGVFVPVLINVTTIDFAQFMRLVMFKLGSTEPPHDVSGLLHDFEAKLVECREAGRKILLVVDEAQNCSAVLLESVRLLLNLAQPGGQALQLVLAGQIGLEGVLAQAELRQFRQRIRVSYRLECLTREEAEAYIVHRLKVAGRDGQLFEASALDRIFALSSGVPRLVNQLADRALLAGFVENAKRIEASHVEDTSGQGPGPIREEPSAAGAIADAILSAGPRERTAGGGEKSPAAPRKFAERRRGRSARRNGYIVGAAVIVVVVVLALTRPGVIRDAWRRFGEAEGSRVHEPPRDVVATPDSVATGGPHDMAESQMAIALPESQREVASTMVTQTAAPTTEAGDMAEAIAPQSDVAVGAPAPASSASPPDSRPVSVHVFSFRTADRAENSRGRLEREGIKTFVLKEMGANGQTWYRVFVGPLDGEDRASAMVDSLRASGLIEYAAITHKMPPTP